ncbi:phospholipase A-2-activating protein [Pancytospora philotis]|nr:phospholipase A-2-activating protein [Pancytospora philotis]
MLHLEGKKELKKGAIKKIARDPLAAACEKNLVCLVDGDGSIATDSMVNSVAAWNGELWAGTQNGKVLRRVGESFEQVYMHSANVCCLELGDTCALSGSWDHEAILYRYSSEKKYPGEDGNTVVLLSPEQGAQNAMVKRSYRHPGSVWCVALLNDNSSSGYDAVQFVTGCADGKIRHFDASGQRRELAFHRSPVRGLFVNGDVVYSVENHGRVHRTTLGGVLLGARSLGTFMYCICRYQDNIAVGGEDGVVYLLNRDLEVLCKAKAPCSTIWDIKEHEGALIACGSDGVLYTYGSGSAEPGADSQTSASSEKAEASEEAPPADEKSEKPKDGIFESGGVRYKIEGGDVYVDKNSKWELMGSAQKKYDHTIPVEFGDKSYTLSFNDKDNVHEVAKRFLHEHKLDSQFHDDIVDHIQKNFKSLTVYKKHTGIDLKGIRKVLGEHPVVPLLEQVAASTPFSLVKSDSPSIYDIEDELFDHRARKEASTSEDAADANDNYRVPDPDIPLFAFFDILKFLVGNGLAIDVACIFRCKIAVPKEAKAFALLMTNLVADSPFELAALDLKIKQLRDARLLTDDDIHHYEENKKIARKK